MPSGNAHMYRQLNGRRLLTGMVLAILTLGLIVVDLGMGSSGIGPGEVVDALLGGPDGDTANTAILWSIRLPMTLTCVFVGGSLSLAGLQIQTITNNALASPYTLGITASASFGAAIAITLGLSVAGYLWIGTALLALVFALAVSLLIFYLGRLKGMSTSTLILSGIIMNFFFQALQQYLQYRASPEIMLDLWVSQSSTLLPLHYQHDFRPYLAYLRTPPLPFRRRPPQSNCLPCTVPDRDYRPRLEPQTNQGGISRTAPPVLASRFHSLPPILHRSVQSPMQSYSKGSWGLSV